MLFYDNFVIIYYDSVGGNVNEKGQALTEFILILPVVLIILLAVFNVSYIYIEKYNLENNLETITDLYQNGEYKALKAYVANENIDYDENKTDKLTKITISKNILISAPVLNKVLGKKLKIEATKTVFSGEVNE